MNRLFRYVRLSAMACLASLFLSGCAQFQELTAQLMTEDTWEQDRTAVTVDSDGTIHETVLDRLDHDWYSAAELQKMIEDTVAAYCAEHGENAVSVDSLETENGEICLTMTYRNAQDYEDYNHVTFYQGSMLGAQMDGFRFDQTFYRVSRGRKQDKPLSGEEPLSHKEWQVLITSEPHVVCLPGRIVYISENGDLLGKQIAEPIPAEEQGENEKGEDHDHLLYVIYEF